MERTNANDFRSNLKEWLDAAESEPIKITRKTGNSFILIKSEDFEEMQIELASLRGIARGLSDVVHGRVKKFYKADTDDIVDRAKKRALAKHKKASGT